MKKKKNKIKTKKQLQVGENIRRFIAKEINKYIDVYKKDDLLTIMKAEISSDLKYCKIFYRCKICNKDDFQKSLDNVSVELSNLIFKNLKIRVRPEVKFIFDNVVAFINEIEKTIKNVEKK